MTHPDDDLRQKIESLQFTLVTPNPVTVTLGESKLTDDIMHLFADHHRRQTVALLEGVKQKTEYKVFDDGWKSVVPVAILDAEISRLRGEL